MACGATGLRPTFGRVPRTGAMALCWSLDKIGPICRTSEDTILVLDAIRGADVGDPSSIDLPLAFDASASLRGVRVGYDPAWFKGNGEHGAERGVIDLLRDLDVNLVRVSLPEWPYEILENILLVEAASAFEELTLTGRDDLLVWQESNAWPNTFRQARFIPGIELIQADRFRRRVMEMMAEIYRDVDVLISPSFAGQLLLITNFTGHPSLTLRTGFNDDDGMPRGVTLWGGLFDEGTLVRLGMSLEQALDVAHLRPVLE
jgi:Asp-tRNA(Asn)/Glu-tRNA(Gln) amidotransferase A subunit family amidase